MTLSRPNLSAATSGIMRMALLVAMLAAPLLALPARGAVQDGILVGMEGKKNSGAGLVIVVGLQRAR